MLYHIVTLILTVLAFNRHRDEPEPLVYTPTSPPQRPEDWTYRYSKEAGGDPR